MPVPNALTVLFDRFQASNRIALVAEDHLPEALARRGKVLVGFFSDPAVHPENVDLAVILPELLKSFPELEAVVPRSCAPVALAGRFGVTVFPALALVDAGCGLGSLQRIQPWPLYAETIRRFLVRSESC